MFGSFIGKVRGISSILLVIFFSVLNGCAKPNYQTLEPATDGTQNAPLDNSQNKDLIISCENLLVHQNLCMKIEWEKSPSVDDDSIMLLSFYSNDNLNQTMEPNYAPTVELWMTSMGHGSAPTQIQKTAVGVYRVTNMFFFMAGEWELRIKFKNGNEIVDQINKKIIL